MVRAVSVPSSFSSRTTTLLPGDARVRLECLALALLIAGIGLVNPIAGADENVLRVSVSDPWETVATGSYRVWQDRRELIAFHHPHEESKAGFEASVSRMLRIPEDWSGRVSLHFYLSDNYDGMQPKVAADSWVGQTNLVGHRYQEVLVDGEAVWSRDVAEVVSERAPNRFTVELPAKIGAGSEFELTFRLVDRVGSMERLAGDSRHVGATDSISNESPWLFQTNVYVGDVVLTSGNSEVPTVYESSCVREARERILNQGPPSDVSQAIEFPVDLRLDGPLLGPEAPSLIHCCLPFPPSVIKDESQISLEQPDGRRLPLQAFSLERWADGSLRTVEVDTLASGPSSVLKLSIDGGAGERQHDSVISERREDGSITLHSKLLQFESSSLGDVFTCKCSRGEFALEDLRPHMEIEGRTYLFQANESRVITEGPLRAEAEWIGKFSNDSETIGRAHLRVAAFAHSPYLQIYLRLANHTPQTLAVSRFELVGKRKASLASTIHWGTDISSTEDSIHLRQLTGESFEVLDSNAETIDSGKRAPGWIAVVSEYGSLACGVRHFREQCPKALHVQDEDIRIRLFEPSEERPHYFPTSGEAKRHEIWIGMWDGAVSETQLEAYENNLITPLRLFDADYFCRSGAFGRAAKHSSTDFAEYHEIFEQQYKDQTPDTYTAIDIRDWGDQIYQSPDVWLNGYYDRTQGLGVAYLLTGQRRWFDAHEAAVRHIMDIDICHYSQEHPNWIGCIYGMGGPNHTQSGPWGFTQRNKGLFTYWRLTGDPQAREAGIGVAEYILRNQAGINAVSVRDHAGFLYSMMAAYDATGDERFLDYAGELVKDAIGNTDRRRGCYLEIHGHMSYRGNVPWMVVQLCEPLFEYVMKTGDQDAAAALVGFAESILTENRNLEVPGDVFGYSHNPHYKKTSGYHTLIAPAIFSAYELTGDPYFLKHARAMYEQTIRERTPNHIMNCYSSFAHLLYALAKFDRAEDPQ